MPEGTAGTSVAYRDANIFRRSQRKPGTSLTSHGLERICKRRCAFEFG